MPLNSSKAAQIQAVTLKTFASRQKTVVFVTLAAGTYSYTATSVILRPQQVVDPQILSASGGRPVPAFDQVLIAPLGTSFTGVVFIADTPTATSGAVSAAQKYEVIEALPVGLVPGGTHIRALLRRMR
ncbi:MAG: hypothetical protein JO202_00340 [Ktedonobacteraceae bacterium]|nr:hypothetical protein [Ktedonobacteraceae bacterium]